MSHAVAHLIRKLQPEIDWVTPESMVQPPQAIQDEGWLSFLNVHNGVSAFNGGLRIFGTISNLLPAIAEWNRSELWKVEYHGIDEGLYFFAEDVFGNQFGFDSQGAVFRFLAETGDREACGQSFEKWLEMLLADPIEELNLWLLDDWR